MSRLYAQYQKRGLIWLAINSGAPGKQGHGLDRNALARMEYGIEYPVLLDESGQVGRSYGAKTTPHIFIISPEGLLLYAGAIDDDPRGANAERVNYVAQVLEQQMKGEKVQPAETSSYGCSVKYASDAPR